MSFGILVFVISLGLGISIANSLIFHYRWAFIILCISAFICSVVIMICAGRKWYVNQQFLDRKLKAETKLIEQNTAIAAEPKNEEIALLGREVSGDKTGDRGNVALVSYKVASVLPNTVFFDFLKDWRVWFTIENHEKKRYKAYIKIKFITDNYEEDASGHYGGEIAWRLNALSGVVAPGLAVPGEIREKAKQGKVIRINILGEIKDENDNLVEKKLPVEYIYDPKTRSWYLEP